jgi:hypothetical protein
MDFQVKILNFESGSPHDPTLSQSLKSVRIIGFAVWFDRGVPEAADGRT